MLLNVPLIKYGKQDMVRKNHCFISLFNDKWSFTGRWNRLNTRLH